MFQVEKRRDIANCSVTCDVGYVGRFLTRSNVRALLRLQSAIWSLPTVSKQVLYITSVVVHLTAGHPIQSNKPERVVWDEGGRVEKTAQPLATNLRSMLFRARRRTAARQRRHPPLHTSHSTSPSNKFAFVSSSRRFRFSRAKGKNRISHLA